MRSIHLFGQMTNQQVQFRFMDCKAEFDAGPGCYLPNTRLKSHR